MKSPKKIEDVIDIKKPEYKRYSDEAVFEVEKLIYRIAEEKIDITGTYSNWVKIGLHLHLNLMKMVGSIFHDISKFYCRYSSEETDMQYSRCLKYNNSTITIGSV